MGAQLPLWDPLQQNLKQVLEGAPLTLFSIKKNKKTNGCFKT